MIRYDFQVVSHLGTIQSIEAVASYVSQFNEWSQKTEKDTGPVHPSGMS